MLAAAMMTELEGVAAASIAMRAAPDVARVRFDDGAVRQAPASSAVVETWRLRALVKDGRLEAFRTWADAQGAGWFDFLASWAGDPWAQGRFVGGPGRVSCQQAASRSGAARWMAEMEVEMRPKSATKGNLPFWPWYAEIKSDLALGGTLRAERTGFQGAGVHRQAAREDAAWRTWRLTAMVEGERLFEFLDWLKCHRMGWIWLPGADGAAWRARIAGGYGGVALRQTGTRAGAARWEAALTLETPAPVETKANVGKSIFDPAVALGDASRVYFRGRLWFGKDTPSNRPRSSWRVVLGFPPPGQTVWQVEIPSRFIQGGGRAWFSTFEFRISGRFRLRLIGLGDASGDVPGPLLTDAARRGLAFIVSWGGNATRLVIGDVDLTEPYTVNTQPESGASLLARRLIEQSDWRDGFLDVAIAWNAPGANNTGFLADFFTTRGGAAAP